MSLAKHYMEFAQPKQTEKKTNTKILPFEERRHNRQAVLHSPLCGYNTPAIRWEEQN
jgi:hypothetical protein